MSSLTRVILIIVLLLCSAFFSMSESAFSYCNQIRMRMLADDGKKSAKRVLKCLDHFDNYIIVSLIGNNIVNILFSVLSTFLCVTVLNDAFIGKMSSQQIQMISAFVLPILTTIVVFFIGEIIPKSIGKTFPNMICRICVYPLLVLNFLFFPISLIYRGIIFILKKIFKTKEDEPLVDEEDLKHIVGNIKQEGFIEEEEKNIIQSAVDFDDTKVKQVMCPRENICAIDLHNQMNKDELIDFILDHPFTRIPVYNKDIDHIIGILHTQKLLKSLMQSNDILIESLLVEPIFVHPNVHLDTLFEEFKKKRTHMAVVCDKDNHTLGIVTMEDVLEELVGEIDDESHEGGDSNE